MEQAVIQIQTEPNGLGPGWLAKSFIVSEENPIPTSWSPNRVQIVMTNIDSFNDIKEKYEKYGWPDIQISYDEQAETISCSGAYEHTWPIN